MDGMLGVLETRRPVLGLCLLPGLSLSPPSLPLPFGSLHPARWRSCCGGKRPVMAQPPHRGGDGLPIENLYARAREVVFEWADSIAGRKVLWVDEAAQHSLALLVTMSELALRNVLVVAPLGLDLGRPVAETQVLYLVSPTEANMDTLTTMLEQGSRTQPHHLGFTAAVPEDMLRRLAAADQHRRVRTVRELPLQFRAISPCFAHAGLSMPVGLNPLLSNAQTGRILSGIWSLITAMRWGWPPYIYYSGISGTARRLAEALANWAPETYAATVPPSVPPATVVIIFRTDDPVSPLLLPWTYHAMLHEHFGIKHDRLVSHAVGEGPPPGRAALETVLAAARQVPGPALVPAAPVSAAAAQDLLLSGGSEDAEQGKPDPDRPVVLSRAFDVVFVALEQLEFSINLRTVSAMVVRFKAEFDRVSRATAQPKQAVAGAGAGAGPASDPAGSSALRRAIMELPLIQRRRRLVNGHVLLVEGLRDRATTHKLIKVSQAMQQLAGSAGRRAAQSALLKLFQQDAGRRLPDGRVQPDGHVQPDSLLALCALYHLRFETDPDRAFLKAFSDHAQRVDPQLPAALQTMESAILGYAGRRRQTRPLFATPTGVGRVRQLMGGGASTPSAAAPAKYVPLCARLAQEYVEANGWNGKGCMDSESFKPAAVPGRPATPGPRAGQGGPLLIVLVGGATLHEAHHISKLNSQRARPGQPPVFLFGTELTRTQEFLEHAVRSTR